MPKEAATTERFPLQEELKNMLFFGVPRKAYRCVCVEVAANGVTIIGFEKTVIDEAAVLVIGGRDIDLVVKWTKPDKNRIGIFHCGLNLTDPSSVNLVSDFQAAGFLKIVKPFAFKPHSRK